jgi:hypothetical protein
MLKASRKILRSSAETTVRSFSEHIRGYSHASVIFEDLQLEMTAGECLIARLALLCLLKLEQMERQ